MRIDLSSWDVVDFFVEGCRVPIDRLLESFVAVVAGFGMLSLVVVAFVKLDIEIDMIFVDMAAAVDNTDLIVVVDNFDPMTDVEAVAIVVAGHNTAVLNIEIVVVHHYSVPMIDIVVDCSHFYFRVHCHEILMSAMILLLHFHY